MKIREYKTGCIRVTVDFLYDIHDIYFSKRTYERILQGRYLKIKGHKFNAEGHISQDHWIFNGDRAGSIYVYSDDGREIFKGYFNDGECWVDQFVNGKMIELKPEVKDIKREERNWRQLRALPVLTPEEAVRAYGSVGVALSFGKGLLLGDLAEDDGKPRDDEEEAAAAEEDGFSETTIFIGKNPPGFLKKLAGKGNTGGNDRHSIKAAPDRNETLPDPDDRKWSDMVWEVKKLRNSNRTDEAMELASRAYRAGENARDPHEASELEKAAIDHRAQGRLSEAEEIFWKVLEIREKVFGREHPFLNSAIGGIIEIYRQSGRQVPEDLEDRYYTILAMHYSLYDLLIWKPLS